MVKCFLIGILCCLYLLGVFNMWNGYGNLSFDLYWDLYVGWRVIVD